MIFARARGKNAEHKLGLVLNPVLLIFDCQHINRELYSLGQLLGKWLSPEGQTHADNQLLFFCMCPSFFRCSSESPSPFRAVLLGGSIGHLVKNSHHSFPDFSRFFYKHSSMPEKKTHTSFTLITVGGCVGVVNPFGKLLCYPHGDYTLFPSIRDSLLTRGAKNTNISQFSFHRNSRRQLFLRSMQGGSERGRQLKPHTHGSSPQSNNFFLFGRSERN